MILGIIYKEGRVINHRSLVKVTLNPILRYFGYQIATLQKEDGSLGKVVWDKCPPVKRIQWEKYQTDYDQVIKKRLLY